MVIVTQIKQQNKRYLPHELSTKINSVKLYRQTYDPEYGCLPLDCGCVMLEKVYCGNAMCRYFRESVLPNDPELNAVLQGAAAKRCKHCDTPFPAQGRRMYCSDYCRTAAQKKQTAKRVQKHRWKKAGV